MNKNCIIVFFSLFISLAAFSQGEWTWMAGDASENVERFYGIQGVPGPLNNPGSRIGAASWTDSQGNLWLFGGRGNEAGDGLLGDLWKYDISTGLWTWMGGSPNHNSYGSYQTKGEPSPGNVPGARQNGVAWTGANGDLWLFGGRGMPSDDDDADDDDEDEVAQGLLNDLWRYSISSGQWTFISGDDGQNRGGRYGTRTEPSQSNYPGARYSANGWIDETGNLWLFAGRGYNSDDRVVLLDDVWKYSPSDNSWAWMKGSETGNQPVSYGQKGEFKNSNTPGGRHGNMTWVDNDGAFWLFGGGTLTQLYADLWKYDAANNHWAWISGSNTPNEQPQFTTQGVPERNAHPGARTLSAVWKDAAGNAWLFGGNGYGGNAGSNPLNNIWKYSTGTNEWTFVKGSIAANPPAVYGTKGEADPNNTPGGTASPAFWSDNNGNLWVFGGRSNQGYLNQVWKFSPGCEQITGSISPETASICDGGSQVLTATGGTSYEWRLNDVMIAGETGATLTATQPGTYSVIVKNGNCSGPASNTAVITEANPPSGGISPAAASICDGGSQVLTATGGTSYEWKLDGNTIEGETSETITATIPGTYSVTINSGGCKAEGSNTSVITLSSTAGLRYQDVQVTANEPARLSARPVGNSYEWIPSTGLDNPSSPTPMVTTSQDVQYIVRITPDQGCEVIDTVQVRVVTAATKVMVPTAFTPDGNNVNDLLRPLSGLSQIASFRVYNRWGNKVFETNQLGAGWDGNYNGLPQPSDTYMWVLTGKLSSGETVKLSGKTLLIR